MQKSPRSSKCKSISILSVVLWIVVATPAPAQQSAQSAGQDEINQQLLQRVQELEKEVQELKGLHGAAAAAPAAPAPVPEVPMVEPLAVNEVAPRLKLNVFGDVGAQGYNHIPDTFLFGSLDLFMTARLSEKASVLGEVLFTASNQNFISPDVERLLFTYRQSEYLTASIGRFHSWVGYYNTAFNYGEFLETTTDRPFIFAFDDQGGVLPMQDVGMNLTGKIPSGKMGLNYVLELSNGHDWIPNAEPVQNNQAAHNSKAINGGLFMRPEAVPGLQLGFSVRHDNLTTPGSAVAETIVAAHAVFVTSKYELLNEGVLVRHVEGMAPVFHTNGFYTQFSRAFRDYRPYFRYQYFNAPNNDPVYVLAGPNNFQPSYAAGFVGRLNGPSVGIRWDFTEHSALKFQYDRISERELPTTNGLTSQIAFTF